MSFKFDDDGLLKSGIYFGQGDHVLAEAALIAGVKFYAGYPITPASEIMERLAYRLPMVDGVFIQMEDEISAIATLIGASWAGAKAMTATSGPGFSLMQENIGLAHMTETPCVIVDIQRAGPSTGQATKPGQGDIMQARWGTHGDHEAIALSPNSVQEIFDLTIEAFNLAEEYRMPVFLMADEVIGHIRERFVVPPREKIKIINRKIAERDKNKVPVFGSNGIVVPMPLVGTGHNVLVTGSTHDVYGYRKTQDLEVHYKLVEHLKDKIARNREKIAKYELKNLENAEIGIISYGAMSRGVDTAIEEAKKKGIEVAHLRLKTIWPMADKPMRELAEQVKHILVLEMNQGQVVREVERRSIDKAKVHFRYRLSAGLFSPKEILHFIKEIKGGFN